MSPFLAACGPNTALVQGVGYGVQAARSGFLDFSNQRQQVREASGTWRRCAANGNSFMKLLMSVFIALNVWLYRVSGGRMMGRMGAAPILLLRRPGAGHDASAR